MPKRLEQSSFTLLENITAENSHGIYTGALKPSCLGRVLALKLKIISKYLCQDKLQKTISVILFWVSEWWLGAGTQNLSQLEELKASVLAPDWLLFPLCAGGCTEQPRAESRPTLALSRFAKEQGETSGVVAQSTHHSGVNQCKYCSVWKADFVVLFFFNYDWDDAFSHLIS